MSAGRCDWCGLFSPTSGSGDPRAFFFVDPDAYEGERTHVSLCPVHEREWAETYGKEGCGLRLATEEEAVVLEVMGA